MLGETEEVGVSDVGSVKERQEIKKGEPWDNVKVAEMLGLISN